jgi:MoxR-like ATPase
MPDRLGARTADGTTSSASEHFSAQVVASPIRTFATLSLMEDASAAIGRRVLVMGMAGAGKSTFSRLLSAKTGLPAIHLDFHYWKPGWVRPSHDEWREKQ